MTKRSVLALLILLCLTAIGPWFINRQFPSFDEVDEPRRTFNVENDFNDAKEFVEHGYGEVKDTVLHFITVISGILVFTITFSEKVVRLESAPVHVRLIMVSGWILFILAIIAAGIGLAFNALALPFAISDAYINGQGKWSGEFYTPLGSSLTAVIMGGYWFVLGLGCIVLSGALSVLSVPAPTRSSAALKST